MAPTVVLAGGAGLVLLGAILLDAFEVMLLPRRVQRRAHFVEWYFRASWALWAGSVRRLGRARRERWLSVYGPLSMVVLLVVWALGLMVAYALLQWAAHHGRPDPPSFATQLYASGVTFLTLGYGDVTPKTALGRVVAVAEAGTGFALVAVVIGYLPVLYQLFSRREAHVIRLDARAGTPPTATTLLARHAEGERLDALDTLLEEWEQWASELLESQLSYPRLAYYRSQHSNQSWLTAVTAVMDACALVLTGLRTADGGVNTFQARMTFATARQTVLEMSRTLGDTRVGSARAWAARERLPHAEFEQMRAGLAGAGLEFADGDEAEAELAEFRDAYEPYVIALARHLLIPFPRWTAEEGALDNWQRSRGARQVKALVEAVEATPG